MKTLMNQLSNKTTPIVCALFAILAILAAPGAFAANGPDTWVGNTSVNLNVAANWTGVNAPPIAGDDWIFGTAGSFGAVLDNSYAGGITVSNILFNGPGAFTFTDNAITLPHSITNASTALQTFNVPITISAPATVSLTAGGGDLTLGGPVSCSSALTLAGAGNLTLTNVSTSFTGSITNGANVTLILTNGAALGGGSAGAYTWNAVANAVFTNFGVFVYSSTATNTFGPRCDGPGPMIINGPGEFISSPTYSWGNSGNITINGGIFSQQKGIPGNARSGWGATTVDGRTITVNSGGIASLDAAYAFGQIQTPPFFHNLVFVANTNGLLRITAGNCVFSNIL
ncbi:MAG TPA: hypothetical protein VN765_13015, partial [Candidatus Acidoferrum sp.]|nr:hypothetical protein [Candidatus Acidoferrum sp.]